MEQEGEREENPPSRTEEEETAQATGDEDDHITEEVIEIGKAWLLNQQFTPC